MNKFQWPYLDGVLEICKMPIVDIIVSIYPPIIRQVAVTSAHRVEPCSNVQLSCIAK